MGWRVMGIKLYALVCVARISIDDDYLSIYLLAIWISSFEKGVFTSNKQKRVVDTGRSMVVTTGEEDWGEGKRG